MEQPYNGRDKMSDQTMKAPDKILEKNVSMLEVYLTTFEYKMNSEELRMDVIALFFLMEA